ncbi:MAG: hypothetical protein A2Z91_08970 [Deltaproteobacteria bacterium GWA2_38_16]|nr:MAG: hypothetical protein A2Z91_08970 [Deltaproteobacteria bacterium GWA2_38_16]OGQ02571.1 MAG: hypothetical protein A3D19_09760 [Deltaproteobacteria bacterium RIFCSPHIGHO2_02_FULL_38_15]OGQ30606.1 MAG: hypothetical protein A3A72_08230 [Deltaproteobacteria bacterium RIFCSPLOWO2_01_FULL_38_9]OGQ60398.1 MAG: hypothetical protein A3G92_03410 [Deltaproteobacteria bacterium RIFCSPLOWO2_12_FULL_38_8]HBQ20974.1 hypothetical protein [Deltaproteobacteria bacterium]
MDFLVANFLKFFFFFIFIAPGLASEIALPSDLITFDKMCNEYRAILNLKFQDLRKTFILKEVSPGEIWFVDSDQQIQMTLRFFHEMNPEKTKKIEKVRITNPEGVALLEEETMTKGHDLTFTDPQKLIFFDPNYSQGSHCSLLDAEESKEVNISSQDSPQFKTMVHRKNTLTEKSVSQHIYIGATHVLTLNDTTQQDGAPPESKRKVEYIIKQTAYRMGALGVTSRSSGGPMGKMWLIGKKKENHIFPNFKYYSEFHGDPGLRGDLRPNQFLNGINDFFYVQFIKSSVLFFLEGTIAHVWPQAERRVNEAASSRFLDELKILRQRADDAQANPSLLVQIKTKLLEFIAAIQDGSLQVNDNRK